MPPQDFSKEEKGTLTSNPPPLVSLPPPSSRKKVGWILFSLVAGLLVYFVYGIFFNENTNTGEAQALTTKVIATIPMNFNTRLGYYLQEHFAFNKDVTEVMYLAENTDTPTEESAFKPHILMRNNEEVGVFLTMDVLSASNDGSRINYAGGRQYKDGMMMVINGKDQSHGAPIQSTDVVFSDDGSHYAYLVSLGGDVTGLIYDDAELYRAEIPRSVYEGEISRGSFLAISPDISPDGSRVAIVSQLGLQKQAVIVNAQTGSIDKNMPLEDIHSGIIFSGDSQHYAYRGSQEGGDVIMLDGEQIHEFQRSRVAWPPVFSADNTQLAFSVDREETMKAFDIATKKEIPYSSDNFKQDTVIADYAAKLVMYPPLINSSKAVTVKVIFDAEASEQAREERLFLEVNDVRASKGFRYISEPEFDPSGQYLIFGVRDGNDLKRMVYKVEGTRLIEM